MSTNSNQSTNLPFTASDVEADLSQKHSKRTVKHEHNTDATDGNLQPETIAQLQPLHRNIDIPSQECRRDSFDDSRYNSPIATGFDSPSSTAQAPTTVKAAKQPTGIHILARLLFIAICWSLHRLMPCNPLPCMIFMLYAAIYHLLVEGQDEAVHVFVRALLMVAAAGVYQLVPHIFGWACVGSASVSTILAFHKSGASSLYKYLPLALYDWTAPNVPKPAQSRPIARPQAEKHCSRKTTYVTTGTQTAKQPRKTTYVTTGTQTADQPSSSGPTHDTSNSKSANATRIHEGQHSFAEGNIIIHERRPSVPRTVSQHKELNIWVRLALLVCSFSIEQIWPNNPLSWLFLALPLVQLILDLLKPMSMFYRIDLMLCFAPVHWDLLSGFSNICLLAFCLSLMLYIDDTERRDHHVWWHSLDLSSNICLLTSWNILRLYYGTGLYLYNRRLGKVLVVLVAIVRLLQLVVFLVAFITVCERLYGSTLY